VTGGVPVKICAMGAAPSGLSWDDHTIVYVVPATGIFRVAATGGTPTLVVPLKPGGLAASPQVLPDGDTILFSLGPPATVTSAYWDKARIVAHSLKTGRQKTLIEGGSSARYLRAGFLVYMLEGTMMAAPFDMAALEITGPAVPVLAGIRRTAGSAGGQSHAAISESGTLAYVPGPSRVGDEDVFLYDRTGDKAEPLGLPRGVYAFPRISRDGKRLAVETFDGKTAAVAIYEMSGTSALRRLTFGGNNRLPVWTSDGKRVAFQSDREGDHAIFWQPLDGGPAERLTRPEQGVVHTPEAWSPTDDVLLFSAMKGMAATLWRISAKDRKAEPVPDAASDSFPPNAVFSPDGRWIAYQSGEAGSGEATTYVQPFPPTGVKFELVRGGRPLWSRDGNEIFVVPGPSQFAAVSVQTSGTFSFKPPVPLVRRFGLAPPASPRPYDVTPDGRLVAVDVAIEGRDHRPSQINVVMNWLEELKAKVKSN
jgi:serine/threonine-protein kinase